MKESVNLINFRKVFPDTTRLSMEFDHELSEEEVKRNVAYVEKEMNAKYFYLSYYGNKMEVFLSREFKDVSAKMTKGAKVKYYNPLEPRHKCLTTITSDGLLYPYGGFKPCIEVKNGPSEYIVMGEHLPFSPFGEEYPNVYYAIYWRPVEEKK